MMKKSARVGCVLGLVLALGAAAADTQSGWTSMFDGKTLDGWKATERPENWKVEDGAIVGGGERSHLFWMGKECTDCEFKAEVKINKGGNSGMYFRAAFGGAGWPKGYEAQVNNSHTDWRRTGSLYGISDTKEQLIPDDTWWTQHIIVKGNRIVIKVNDKVVVDHVDQENRFQKGYLALQQHDPGSVVHYRNLQMREIPSTSQ